jgi:hypothetical protein
VKLSSALPVILFIIVQISFGQISGNHKIDGQVFNESAPVEGVNISNETTRFTTVSDVTGKFSIVVRDGDVLVFSSVNLEPLQIKITTDHIASNLLIVKMKPKETELKEVVVSQNTAITAENLGIIPKGQKKYTPAERKVYTATSTNVDRVLNAISGRTAMLKKEAKVEQKEVLFSKLEYLFDEDYYTERLKIPADYIKGFQQYCIENDEFALSLNTKNKTMSMFLITGLAQEYLKIIEHEK